MLLNLNTGDLLQVDSLRKSYCVDSVKCIFNTVLKRTGSYTKTKQLMRVHYGLFILIIRP